MKVDGPALPLLASGEFSGYAWEFRGTVIGDSAHTWTSCAGRGGSTSGGGAGALPYADLGVKVLGAIGSTGESRGSSAISLSRLVQHPAILEGVVASAVARVRIEFEDGDATDAALIDSNAPDVRFFVAVTPAKWKWRTVIVLDSSGQELDRFLPVPLPRA